MIIRLIPLVKFVLALIIGYKVLNGLSWYQMANRLIEMLPMPHPMTEDEQKIWFDRAQGNIE